MMQGLLPFSPSGTMNAAAPDGARPRRIGDYSKNSFPAMPRRGPDAGIFRLYYNFHDSGLNRIDSCPFLQSHFFN